MVSPARLSLEPEHRVLTPEYVEFSYPLAGLYSRFLAWLIDRCVVIFGTIGVLSVLSRALAWAGGFAGAMAFVIWFLMDWGYGVTLEWLWRGQTLGKRALGLRVLQESGVRIGFTHAALRNLARPLDGLPPPFYAVGGIAVLLSSSQQRLGDLLAGTVVVRERRLAAPSSIVRDVGESAMLKDARFLGALQRLSREEQELLISAALRREELSLEARLSLFSAIAQRLEAEVSLPRPEHLSDEKLVVLAAAAVVQRRSRSAGASSRS